MANTVLTLVELGSRSATFNSDALDVLSYGAIGIDMDVQNVSGSSPTLDVVIQHRSDDSLGWTTLYTFAQVTAVAHAFRCIPNTTEFGFLKEIRAVCTIGGTTPNFTFAILVVAKEAT
jgi:hypothetical protein